jgi:hypothetical protein
MVIPAVLHQHVQIAQCVGREGLEKVFDQLGIEVANLGIRKRRIENQVIAARKINRRRTQRLFHRQCEVAVPSNASFVTQSLLYGLAETDAYIFHRVVLINV